MQDAWGIEFARKAEKRRIMEREKKRRQRAMQAVRIKEMASVVVLERPRFDVFMTRSGLLAMRPRQPRVDGSTISLPYVEFLYGRVHIDLERLAA